MTSNMDTVLDVAPYNNHTVKCIVSHGSFSHITGTLMFSFIRSGVSLHSENKTFSQSGPNMAFSNISEAISGLVRHNCTVTWIINEITITNKTNGTTVVVVGKHHVSVCQL